MSELDPTRLAQPAADPYQRGVIWDLDGTLIDSSRLHFDAWRELLEPEGVELDWSGFITGFGPQYTGPMVALLGPYGKSGPPTAPYRLT